MTRSIYCNPYIIYIILMLSLLPLTLSSQSTSQTPNSLSSQTQYANKLNELNQLAGSGVVNPDLYNNLGICYYHLNQKGYASLYFLKALNLNSAHSGARQNLLFVQSQIPDFSLYPKRSILVQKIFDLYDFMNLDRLALAVLICLFLFTLALALLWHRRDDELFGLALLVIFISSALLLLSTAILITKLNRQKHNRKAVVISQTISGFTNITASDSPRFQISEGLILEVETSRADWSYVRLPNGVGGWVENTGIAKVQN